MSCHAGVLRSSYRHMLCRSQHPERKKACFFMCCPFHRKKDPQNVEQTAVTTSVDHRPTWIDRAQSRRCSCSGFYSVSGIPLLFFFGLLLLYRTLQPLKATLLSVSRLVMHSFKPLMRKPWSERSCFYCWKTKKNDLFRHYCLSRKALSRWMALKK